MQVAELSGEQRAKLEEQERTFKAQLAEAKLTGGDTAEPLESAAVTLAQLSKFDEANELLKQLVALKPNDVQAWRLLVSACTCLVIMRSTCRH